MRLTLLVFMIATATLVAIAGYNDWKKQSSVTTENHVVTNTKTSPVITEHENTVTDWQTGWLKPIDVIYEYGDRRFAVSSGETNLLTEDMRKNNFNASRYSVLYTIQDDEKYYDAVIDTATKKVTVKGLPPAEPVVLYYNQQVVAAAPADWAGRMEISLRPYDLRYAEHLCLKFKDSDVGICHKPVRAEVSG